MFDLYLNFSGHCPAARSLGRRLHMRLSSLSSCSAEWRKAKVALGLQPDHVTSVTVHLHGQPYASISWRGNVYGYGDDAAHLPSSDQPLLYEVGS